jgi:hypothetical protein
MLLREETTTLKASKGRLEVRQHSHALGLFADGKPVTLTWAQCDGSILQDYLHLRSFSAEDDIAALRECVAQGFLEGQSLRSQIRPFFEFFTPGTYQLVLEDIPSWWMDEWESEDHAFVGWFYPTDDKHQNIPNLLATQSYATLDEKQILAWMYAIEAGARPIVLTATATRSDWTEFILDGHHKLYAYAMLNIPPRRLKICGISPHPLRSSNFPQTLDTPYGWKRAFGEGT